MKTTKSTWLVCIVVSALAACAPTPDEVGEVQAAQLLVPATAAGVWQWTLVTPSATTEGYVVCRGTAAAPIRGYDYAQNTETWYATRSSAGGTAQVRIQLALVADPGDAALLSLVADVRRGTLLGSAPMVPDWRHDVPLAGAQIYTLRSVTGAPGAYSGLYGHVSFAMPDPGRMPTFYSDDGTLVSIFGGGSSIFTRGITATFEPTSSGQLGYPSAAWFYCGRDFD